jgi:hypothetical protein
MNPKIQRIALGFIGGWTHPNGSKSEQWLDPATGFRHMHLPDYLNDLNAIHELEKTLSPVLAEDYAFRLKTQDLIHDLCFFVIAHTTAPQRCEAILKTFDKWEGSE